MEIHGIHGPQPVNGPQGVQPSNPTTAADQVQAPDQLEISQEAEMASQAAELVEYVHQLPDIRTDRVDEIRAAIEAGTYETEERLDIAVDRLLDEIG
jgi:negative regulator of flagellin synthesis FlgM